MEETKIFYADGESPKMVEAFKKAPETFKYFWRELSWEYHRMLPALDIAYVKIPFTQKIDDETKVEQMWINYISFDGDTIYGTLINQPYELTNVNNGDEVQIPRNQISDWIFAINGKTYGGFTVQAMRSEMSENERKEHDKAWGFDFGDFNEVMIVHEQKEKPENIVEHPLSKNMKDSLIDFINKSPEELTSKDEFGNTFLHRQTIAGNSTSVEIIIASGADVNAKNEHGKTALDYAKELKWDHLLPLLQY